MAQYIDKDALVAEIERQISAIDNCPKITNTQISVLEGNKVVLTKLLSFLDTLEVKEVDVDKMLYFRRNIGFAYPEGASEYQKHLACYRQGIEDVLKAQKGEKV